MKRPCPHGPLLPLEIWKLAEITPQALFARTLVDHRRDRNVLNAGTDRFEESDVICAGPAWCLAGHQRGEVMDIVLVQCVARCNSIAGLPEYAFLAVHDDALAALERLGINLTLVA